MRHIIPTVATATLALAGVAYAESGRGPATDACPEGPLTLTLLRAQNNLPPDELIDKWEEANLCTTIEVTEVPFGQLFDKIAVVGASANPPDIVSYDGPDTASYASAGLLLPLGDALPNGLIDDLMPATVAENSYDGKLYSPGIEQATLALFYNKDMLEPLGIEPPKTLEDAWTWDEAMEAFKACQQGPAGNAEVWGLAPSRFGAGTPGFAYRDLLFVRSAGDPEAPEDSSLYKTYWALSPDGTEVDGWLNTPEAVEAAQMFQDMFNEIGITSKAGIPNAFQDGKACFTIDMQYLEAGLEANPPGFEWSVTPLPYIKTPIVHTGSLTLGVMAKSEFTEEATQFVIDMSTGELAKDWLKMSGSLPNQASLMLEFPVSIFSEQLAEWGHPRPPTAKFLQYNRVVSDALRDIAYGADPKETLDAAVAQLTPMLAQ